MQLRADAHADRIQLDASSWIEVTRRCLDGADELYDLLVERLAWQQGRVFRYERSIDEPRLGSACPIGARAVHPVLNELHRSLQRRYRHPLTAPAAAWYRDGRDSVAFHRDRDLRHLDDTLIAILTLGAQRPFLVRPRAHRHQHGLEDRFGPDGATHDLSPAAGDLLVMGGATQLGWEHAVPKHAGLRAGRISLQWRWTSGHGRPVVGASYRAPRTYRR